MIARSRWALHPLVLFTIIAAVLGAAAAIAQPAQSGDRDIYQRIGRRVIVLDCDDIHCFRLLPAILLEHLPGASIVKWKAYAVVANAAAAIAIGALCTVLGLSARASAFAAWIAAFGFGPFQSVFDPYTSDPMMYLMGPVLLVELVRDRIGRAALLGAAGVLSKEFAAVPLWIFALTAAVRRRWTTAARAGLAALTATLVWLTLQTLLLTIYNYSYGGNKSVDLLHGSYFVVWVRALGWARAVAYLLLAFGPLLILLAAGWRRAGDMLRLLAVCSLPAVAAFVYVQQPDRALWNFHFVVIPIAMLALEELPDALCWTFVVSFAIANVRLGDEQPAALTWIRGVALSVSIVVAIVAAVRVRREGHGVVRAPGFQCE
jgi:hypothetical protein